ncbi:MCM8 [Lepeophtheirus salmonis]|uniref:Flavin-containing monooxygenase n=1 Tax=Lepeophtheirus salmonis TaxID=72036 RepID=A0A7R8CFV5_LEPSM|nr:MCM8 [Lepeophtheirus salmonis]CAF2809934.1 MCM8 [Lepeophtheirus salmonis]
MVSKGNKAMSTAVPATPPLSRDTMRGTESAMWIYPDKIHYWDVDEDFPQKKRPPPPPSNDEPSQESVPCPYPGWHMSFLDKSSSKGETLDYMYDKRTFSVKVESLLYDGGLLDIWPDFKSALFDESPEYTINMISLAKHQNVVMSRKWPIKDKFPLIRARLIFKFNEFPFMNIKASLYGKLITLKGTVVRVSNIKPLCTWLAFKCSFCSHTISINQPEGRYTTPKRCSQCKRGSFEPLRVNSKTITEDWQRIRLQELVQHESGRVPRSIEVDIFEDLCDTSVPGDVGYPNWCCQDNYGFIRQNCLNDSSGGIAGLEMGLKLTNSDFSAIRGIYDDFGKDLFKGLFGGTSKFSNDKSNIPVRGDPHILVVGDPGLGKSQMLTTCAKVAPRGVFVTGNTTTTAGLTVTLTKDGSNDFTLEAGALILADQGHCCIDEFDKMQHQHQSLLETMEQQAVSVAKGGVVCTLPARTAVLAAANPVGGHYDQSRTVSENLKMSPALLSRFDIVFILIDRPDENLDQYLSDHIMKLHRKQGRSSALNFLNVDIDVSQVGISNLKERLKNNSKQMRMIPSDLMRKKQRSSDVTPITLRQLESMIRLTEARAKLELREKANREDAEDVIEIMKSSMVDVYKDQNGVLDFSRSQNGSGMSNRSSAKKFVIILQKQATRLRKNIFTVEEMRNIASILDSADRADFLESFSNNYCSSLCGHKKIAIIGAGAAGVCAARRAVSLLRNWVPYVFELGSQVGGTWIYDDNVGINLSTGDPIHSSMYKGLKTNLPKEHTEFHTKVLSVCPRGSKWSIETLNLLKNEQQITEFDAVVVCNGHYSTPTYGQIKGIDSYSGKVLHSHNYRIPEPYKGKRVLVFGAASSGIDISIEIAKFASKQVPGIVSYEESFFVLQDNSCLKDIDVLLYCTGYKFDFPFLHRDCAITVDIENRRVHDLYKHCINFFYKSLSGELILPREEIMLNEIEKRVYGQTK